MNHPNERWNRCVEDGKLLLIARSVVRQKICELAMEACEIKRGGGGHWSGFDNQNHIGKYAEAIGMSPKTLGNWLIIYRFVYLKVPEKDRCEFNWSIGERVRKKFNKKEIANKNIARQYHKLSNETDLEKLEFKIDKYISNIRSNLTKSSKTEKKIILNKVNALISEFS